MASSSSRSRARLASRTVEPNVLSEINRSGARRGSRDSAIACGERHSSGGKKTSKQYVMGLASAPPING